MKTSEFLSQQIEKSAQKSLSTLWLEATGDVYDNNGSDKGQLALYFVDGEFVIVNYISRADNSWKQAFEQQNPAIFIGYVDDTEMQIGTVTDMLLTRISDLQHEGN